MSANDVSLLITFPREKPCHELNPRSTTICKGWGRNSTLLKKQSVSRGEKAEEEGTLLP